MFARLAIPEVFVFAPTRFEDSRGYLVETFNRALLETATGPLDWVQDNHSRSNSRWTVRGLHFQAPPFAQDKLVRCISGRILDIAVDIRRGSPTFGRYVSATLTAEGGEQVFVPKGFAHGFVTLEHRSEVLYKVTNYYSGAHDRCIRWNDPTLNIEWGVLEEDVIVSSKDAAAPMLSQTADYFRYGD